MTPTDSSPRPAPRRRAAFDAWRCDCCTPATRAKMHANGEPPIQASEQLDTIVLLLGAITSGGGDHLHDSMVITLHDGRQVDIWESGNDGGFKWAYARPARTEPQP